MFISFTIACAVQWEVVSTGSLRDVSKGMLWKMELFTAIGEEAPGCCQWSSTLQSRGEACHASSEQRMCAYVPNSMPMSKHKAHGKY